MEKKQRRVFTEAEKRRIVEFYQTHTLVETMKKFRTTRPTLKKLFDSQDIQIRQNYKFGKNICSFCKRAARFIEFPCPWARSFEPVEGWKAKKITKIDAGQKVSTYYITKCPLFMPDD